MTDNSIEALIIDDEKDICFLLNGILEQRKIHSGFVTSLSEAREALPNKELTMLFLDNYLPDGSGVDFLGFVKETYPNAKVVMITAHDSQQDRRKAYEGGVDYFISKPFTRAQINEVIDKMWNAQSLGKNIYNLSNKIP